jgi:hypothetical protein
MDEAKRYMAEYLRQLLLTADHVEELWLGLFFGPVLHDLGISSLPTPPTLRVLHISRCNDWNWKQHSSQPARLAPPLPFPRLVQLRLHLCTVSLHILQGVLDAAPLLATLQLDSVDLWLMETLHVRCPKVTTLGLVNLYSRGYQCQNIMELDAPLLQCFAYQGPLRSLSLKSLPTDMTRVDLRFQVPAARPKTDDKMCQLFWKFVQNFRGASTINLNFQRQRNAMHF